MHDIEDQHAGGGRKHNILAGNILARDSDPRQRWRQAVQRVEDLHYPALFVVLHEPVAIGEVEGVAHDQRAEQRRIALREHTLIAKDLRAYLCDPTARGGIAAGHEGGALTIECVDQRVVWVSARQAERVTVIECETGQHGNDDDERARDTGHPMPAGERMNGYGMRASCGPQRWMFGRHWLASLAARSSNSATRAKPLMACTESVAPVMPSMLRSRVSSLRSLAPVNCSVKNAWRTSAPRLSR